MKIAILGGTFDPIHRAHVAAARAAADQLQLDKVLIVPAANPPWKDSATPYEDRLRMVEIACAADPRLEASRLEEGAARSYTMETIERAQTSYPSADLYFVIGADAFADIEKWHRAQELVAAVSFIVVTRPGHDYAIPPGARVHRLDTLALRVSSSEIRQSLRRGKSPSDLDPAVLDYIRSHALYR